jgi:hypothetical protein
MKRKRDMSHVSKVVPCSSRTAQARFPDRGFDAIAAISPIRQVTR